MKKLVFTAVTLLALTSCKKDFVCDCKLNSSATPNYHHNLIELTKKEAKEACKAKQFTGINTCELR